MIKHHQPLLNTFVIPVLSQNWWRHCEHRRYPGPDSNADAPLHSCPHRRPGKGLSTVVASELAMALREIPGNDMGLSENLRDFHPDSNGSNLMLIHFAY